MSRAISWQGRISVVGLFSLSLAGFVPTMVHADSTDGSWLPDSVSVGGFIRAEVATKTSEAENPNNQDGNPFNGRALNPDLPNPAIPTSSSSTRPVTSDSPLFNLHYLRAGAVLGWRINDNLKFVGKLTAIADPGDYSDFNAGNLDQFQGGISGGDHALYGGATNLFQYRVMDANGKVDSHPNPLEWDGARYQVYFPSLFLNYASGPLDLKIGEQTIAWGNAIFFRVFDTANGLDLRRHSILDYAQEEYSDKRVPAPAVRLSYQVNQALLVDGYVEKFQPTIYGNPNTPYNAIPSQFTVHDRYGEYEDKLNYAIRAVATFSDWSLEAFAGRRYNPDGAFRWTQSGVNSDLSAPFPAGNGAAVAQTPFGVEAGGVYSAAEWFHYAAQTRLNGVTGFNAGVNDFAASAGLGAVPLNTVAGVSGELNQFFEFANGGLRGHIERDYFQEYNFGVGAGYTTHGAPGSLLDQLLIHLEIRYTPDRTFTSPSLGAGFLRQNDWVGALTFEKYERFFDAFPSTYFVLQYMHRTRSDLFGRSLEGYGGTDTTVPPGVSGANYIVLAMQQPLPLDIFQLGFAALYDPRGGVLLQPGVVWRASQHVTLSGFYNYVNGHLSGNPNNNLFGTESEYANEVTLRLGYQF